MQKNYHCQLTKPKFVSILRSSYGLQKDAIHPSNKLPDTSNQTQELFSSSRAVSLSKQDINHYNSMPSSEFKGNNNVNEEKSSNEKINNIHFLLPNKVIEEPLFSSTMMKLQHSDCQNHETLSNTHSLSEEYSIQQCLSSKPMAFKNDPYAAESLDVSMTRSEQIVNPTSIIKMDILPTTSNVSSVASVEPCHTAMKEITSLPTKISNLNTDLSFTNNISMISTESGSGVKSNEESDVNICKSGGNILPLKNYFSSKSLETNVGNSGIIFPEQSGTQACVQVCSMNNLVLFRNNQDLNSLNSVNGLLVLNSTPIIVTQPVTSQNPEVFQPGNVKLEATGNISNVVTARGSFLSTNSFLLPYSSQALSDSRNFVLLPVTDSSTVFPNTSSDVPSSFSVNITPKSYNDDIIVPNVSEQPCSSVSDSKPYSSLSSTEGDPGVQDLSSTQADVDSSNVIKSQCLQSLSCQQKWLLPCSSTTVSQSNSSLSSMTVDRSRLHDSAFQSQLILMPEANMHNTQMNTQTMQSAIQPPLLISSPTENSEVCSSLMLSNSNIPDLTSLSSKIPLPQATVDNANAPEESSEINLQTAASDVLKQSNETAASLADLLRPLYKFIKNKKCLLCGFESKAKYDYAVRQHLVVHLERKIFRCNICDKIFMSQKALSSHSSMHSDEFPFTCTICGEKFRQRGTMNSHRKRRHLNGEKYECVICNKFFTKRKSLKCHLRIHTGERPYMCPVCLDTFQTLGHLKNHSIKHSAEKPYQCLHCTKSFTRKSNLKDHMQSHDENSSKYKCDKCDKTFTFQSNLHQHKLTHSNERNHACDFCGMKFKLPHHLKAHILTHKLK